MSEYTVKAGDYMFIRKVRKPVSNEVIQNFR